MTRRYLKHILLFFLTSFVIVGAAEESVVDTDNSPEYYKEEDYVKLDDIGSGSYGAVSKVREKKTGKIYALKTFPFVLTRYAHAESEIKALEQLDHKNIVKMIAKNLGARSEGDSVHIVLEHMPCNLDAALSYSAT
ncbi:MAG: CMGC/CDK protein kinase, partial [Amphiamblys sp. WSBS2006]